MMRRVLAWKVRILTRWFDESISPQRIDQFLNKHPQPLKVGEEVSPITADAIHSQQKWVPANIQMTAEIRKSILWLDKNGDPNQKKLVEVTMEKYLRHVEVKRKKSFYDTGKTRQQLSLSHHETAILFCSYARIHHDLRFLNAAFKLNDWEFRRYEHGRTNPSMNLYLLALREQEAAVKELLV